MKHSGSIGIVFALYLFLVTSPLARGSVRVLELLESSQSPRITVRLNEKPLPDVKLEVRKDARHSRKPVYVLVTDSKGQAVVPRLSPGKYFISASAEGNLSGELYLHIESTKPKTSNQFLMDLERYDPRPTYEEELAAAEKSEAANTYAAFRGGVFDITGVVVPRVSIDVIVDGTQGKTRAARCRTDKNGRFSAPVAEGRYVAVFRYPGFKVLYFPLTIAGTGSENEMQAVLKIGDSSE